MRSSLLKTNYTLHNGTKCTWAGDVEKLNARIADLTARIENTRRHAPTYTGISDINDGIELAALNALKDSLTSKVKPDLKRFPPSKGWVAVKNPDGTYDYENQFGLGHFFPKNK